MTKTLQVLAVFGSVALLAAGTAAAQDITKSETSKVEKPEPPKKPATKVKKHYGIPSQQRPGSIMPRRKSASTMLAGYAPTGSERYPA